MSDLLADKIIQNISQASEQYHRLIIVVAPSGTGKTKALHTVSKQIGVPVINLNLQLSTRMLDLTERQRVLQLPRLLSEIVNESSSNEMALLDNIEMLFAESLKQDPLRLLQGLSRNKTVVVDWNGSINKDCITYAAVDHPEYKKYPIHGFLIVIPDEKI